MKIVVLGPHHSGKSTFVRQFCGENAMNIDKIGIDGPTTVAMDFGCKEFHDIKLFVFGTPGMAHFSIIREILSKGADGIIFMIDSSDPSKDGEVREIWDEAQNYASEVPIIVLANKQDVPNSRSAGDLRGIFEFLENIPIIETSTKDNSFLDEAMEELLKQSLDKMVPIISILNKYHAKMKAFQELRKDLGLTREEFRKYLRFLEIRNLIQIDWYLEMFWLAPPIKSIVAKLEET